MENLITQDNIISSTLNKIKKGNITKEEIEELSIEFWPKELLIVAWYYRVNRFKGIPYIKELKTKYQQDNDKIQIIKELLNRFKIKGKVSYDDIYDYLQFCMGLKDKKISNLQISTIMEDSITLKQNLSSKERQTKKH